MKLLSVITFGIADIIVWTSPSMAGTFTDNRDGKIYRIVEINGVTWMAENLNYSINSGKGSWCYQNEERNCNRFGRLYLWNVAQEVCPTGWHLPTESELNQLIGNTGGEEYAGHTLKSNRHWKVARDDYGTLHNGNGSDTYGFSLLPAGYKGEKKGEFFGIGNYAGIWSATRNNALTVCDWVYACEDDFVYWQEERYNFAFSVRCVYNGSYNEDDVTADAPDSCDGYVGPEESKEFELEEY